MTGSTDQGCREYGLTHDSPRSDHQSVPILWMDKDQHPKSDTLRIDREVFLVCPKCGSQDIGLVDTSSLRGLFFRLKESIFPND